MLKASFFIWQYHFYEDRVEIFRDFVLTRTNVIYVDKIELVVFETDMIFKRFHRCNLLLTFAGNIFPLIGVPIDIAELFCDQVGHKLSVRSESFVPVVDDTSVTDNAVVTDTADIDAGADDAGVNSAEYVYALSSAVEEPKQIIISHLDLLKKSLLQTKLRWYLLLIAALWALMFLMGSELITSEEAHFISNFVFRHMITAGTLVLSLGLPTIIIWIWAFTGGFLMEYLKFYQYTATRKGNILRFEYGLLLHRRVYISVDRIAITEFRQTPIMRICGYGKLDVRAVGYNSFFLKSQPILPFVKAKKLPDILKMLLPEIQISDHKQCHRSLAYDFVSWKCLLPLFCAAIYFLLGYAWLIAAGVVLIIVIFSILLEYQNTDFLVQNDLTVLSTGGFYRTAAWIYTERVELIAISASRRKKQKGFVNVRLKVFGKRGNYALVRNIEKSAVKDFQIPGL